MKKEEFIKYLEGVALAFEAAGINNMTDLMDQILMEANTIEISITYPQYPQPYTQPYTQPYWNTWCKTTTNIVVDTVTELLGDDLPQWEVKVTGPEKMDWEIKRCV